MSQDTQIILEKIEAAHRKIDEKTHEIKNSFERRSMSLEKAMEKVADAVNTMSIAVAKNEINRAEDKERILTMESSIREIFKHQGDQDILIERLSGGVSTNKMLAIIAASSFFGGAGLVMSALKFIGPIN